MRVAQTVMAAVAVCLTEAMLAMMERGCNTSDALLLNLM